MAGALYACSHSWPLKLGLWMLPAWPLCCHAQAAGPDTCHWSTSPCLHPQLVPITMCVHAASFNPCSCAHACRCLILSPASTTVHKLQAASTAKNVHQPWPLLLPAYSDPLPLDPQALLSTPTTLTATANILQLLPPITIYSPMLQISAAWANETLNPPKPEATVHPCTWFSVSPDPEHATTCFSVSHTGEGFSSLKSVYNIWGDDYILKCVDTYTRLQESQRIKKTWRDQKITVSIQ